MATFIYPTSAELQQVAQDKMPALMKNRPCFDIFPARSVDSHLLIWEQLDNFLGLQQVRGMDGEPSRVKKIGAKRYTMVPGVYGEFIDLDEQELTARRQYGTFGTPVDISDLVMLAQDQLLQRRLDRIEAIIWTLITTGTFSVSLPTGGVAHTDTYTLQTASRAVSWATVATATPLADFRAVQLLHRGHSVSFGKGARAFMNRGTFNTMISNTNAADLYGRRTAGLGTFNNLPQLNDLLAGDDLPQITIYDEGYLDDSNTFQLFIPDGKVAIVGQRPAGQVIGEYRFTRNANNPNLAPGPYMKVVDLGDVRVPRRIDVHDGHNGGPVIYFPSAVVILTTN